MSDILLRGILQMHFFTNIFRNFQKPSENMLVKFRRILPGFAKFKRIANIGLEFCNTERPRARLEIPLLSKKPSTQFFWPGFFRREPRLPAFPGAKVKISPYKPETNWELERTKEVLATRSAFWPSLSRPKLGSKAWLLPQICTLQCVSFEHCLSWKCVQFCKNTSAKDRQYLNLYAQ